MSVAATDAGPSLGRIVTLDPNDYPDIAAFRTALEGGDTDFAPLGDASGLDFATMSGVRCLVGGEYLQSLAQTGYNDLWYRIVLAVPADIFDQADLVGRLFSTLTPRSVRNGSDEYVTGIDEYDGFVVTKPNATTYQAICGSYDNTNGAVLALTEATVKAWDGGLLDLRMRLTGGLDGGIVTAITTAIYAGDTGLIDFHDTDAAIAVPAWTHVAGGISIDTEANPGGGYLPDIPVFGFARAELYDAAVNADPFGLGGEDPPDGTPWRMRGVRCGNGLGL